jgi:hypothetical protein
VEWCVLVGGANEWYTCQLELMSKFRPVKIPASQNSDQSKFRPVKIPASQNSGQCFLGSAFKIKFP